METVSATLVIGVFVDCPHCKQHIDLMDAEDTAGYDHNGEGHVASQACPDGCWSEKHPSFEVEEVECSNCRGTFNVKGLEW